MTFRLFDTHLHLDLIDNSELLVNRIIKSKIYTIAVTNLPPLYEKLRLQNQAEFIRPALGFHPELVSDFKKYIPKMWDLLHEARYIGEVGLDKQSTTQKESYKLQLKFFEDLVIKSSMISKKIFSVHSRNSAQDVLDIIGDNFNGHIVLHWFSGSKTELKKALNNGYYFSINYKMTKSKKGKDFISEIPISKLLLESDAPFVKIKSTVYNPKELELIIEGIAEIKNVSLLECAQILWNNFLSILNDT